MKLRPERKLEYLSPSEIKPAPDNPRRHTPEQIRKIASCMMKFGAVAASASAGLERINLCIWTKPNGGMGSFYRSRHELCFVFQNPGAAYRNNVQLGRFKRNRTNVWEYPGANAFPRKGEEDTLALHPTIKPIALVADAILDSTRQGDVVLDPFLGSGTTILAAERTKRRGYGIELDPLYADTAILRWQRLTKRVATLSTGQTFDDVSKERNNT